MLPLQSFQILIILAGFFWGIESVIAEFFFEWPNTTYQCMEAVFKWDSGGTPPYTAVLLTNLQPAFVYHIPPSSPNPYPITVQFPQGTQYIVLAGDSSGIDTGGSSIIQTVQAPAQQGNTGNGKGCLNQGNLNTNQTKVNWTYEVSGGIQQCGVDSFSVTWDPASGSAPYNITIIPFAQEFQPFTLPLDPSGNWSWTPNITAGTSFTVLVNDAKSIGSGGVGSRYIVGGVVGKNTGCLNNLNGGNGISTGTRMGTMTMTASVGASYSGGLGVWPTATVTTTATVAAASRVSSSTGIAVGAAVGGISGVLLGILIGFLLWRRNRKRRLALSQSNNRSSYHNGDQGILDLGDSSDPYKAVAMMSAGPGELSPYQDQDDDAGSLRNPYSSVGGNSPGIGLQPGSAGYHGSGTPSSEIGGGVNYHNNSLRAPESAYGSGSSSSQGQGAVINEKSPRSGMVNPTPFLPASPSNQSQSSTDSKRRYSALSSPELAYGGGVPASNSGVSNSSNNNMRVTNPGAENTARADGEATEAQFVVHRDGGAYSAAGGGSGGPAPEIIELPPAYPDAR